MFRSLALALVIGSLGCGGKAVIDATRGEEGGGGTGGSAPTSSGSGGCDSASHSIDLANYNVGCTLASDCMAVFGGDFCGECHCPFSAINVADATKYQAEAQIKSAGAPPSQCFCPASVPTCSQGTCATKTP